MWLNNKEENIIKDLYFCIHSTNKKQYYRLSFDNENVYIVKYLTDADSDNGLDISDVDYEEFTEFYFEIIKVEKKSLNKKVRKGQMLEVNYKNFPIKWEVVEQNEI